MLPSENKNKETLKQSEIFSESEQLMAEARQSFQELSKTKDHDKMVEIYTVIMNSCERASQLINSVDIKEVIPERYHMTQSLKNSINSQSLFYMKWIEDKLEENDLEFEGEINYMKSKKDKEISVKDLLAELCLSERILVTNFEKNKNTENFQKVLTCYRKLLFTLIDFFEAHLANLQENQDNQHIPVGN